MADWSNKKKDELLEILEKIVEKFPTDVIKDAKPMRNAEHPTMKPITLCAKLIRNSSRETETVYDAFAGSGSTLMACEQMNRTSYNMELAENYCDVIVKRFAQTFGSDGIYLERNGEKVPLEKTKIL
jgi:DNA modification methylase